MLGDLDAIDRNLLDRQEVFALLAGMQEVKAWGSNDKRACSEIYRLLEKTIKIYDSFSPLCCKKDMAHQGCFVAKRYANLECFLSTTQTNLYHLWV
ncbi:MAG: hypothetical protein CM15mP83_2250 [Flavobacteriaceae bacterium]|nr:MAG: hypothetical protein CM15mP83_2250 [Flavobacteriaceae bacterium]